MTDDLVVGPADGSEVVGAPFVTGGANLPFTSGGNGSLPGSRPGSGLVGTGDELFWREKGCSSVCFGVWLPKGRIGGAPVTCETSSFSAIGEGEFLPFSAPAAVLKLMRSLS